MKASDLRDQLAGLMQKHGDLDVMIDDGVFESLDVTDVGVRNVTHESEPDQLVFVLESHDLD